MKYRETTYSQSNFTNGNFLVEFGEFNTTKILDYMVYNCNYGQLCVLCLYLSIAAVQLSSVSVSMILLSLVTPVIALLFISPAYSVLVSISLNS